MKKNKDKQKALLIAMGVGVGIYAVIKIVEGQSRQRQIYTAPVVPVSQPKGKGVKTAIDVIAITANLANTLFGAGGPFAKKSAV